MKKELLIFFLLLSGITAQASAVDPGKEEPMDAFGLIMEHISDSHQWHVIDYTNRRGYPVHINVPLPVILWHNNSLWFYTSGDFYHGNHPLPLGDDYVILRDEHFFITGQEGVLKTDEAGNIINASPLDFSITKNVASMLMSMALLLLIFLSAGKAYARYGMAPPKGFRGVLEPIILFVRDDVARSQISKDKADKFVPFLLTLFFFIWINNMIGIVPFFPGGSNLSGNISFTATLAVFSFLVINVFAVKDYWKHIFLAPGMPFLIRFLLVPLEFIGILTKPFALMVRLFANITAGHIIILSLISIIFIIKSIYIAPVSILLSLVMFMLELLVAVLQAYIFTLLTALFIGMSTTKSEH